MKKIKLTSLILLLLGLLLPISPVSAVGNVQLGYGYSFANPYFSYQLNGDSGAWWSWGRYEQTFPGYADLYLHRFVFNNDNPVQQQEVPAYTNGRQAVYIMTKGCVFTGGTSGGQDWRLEGVSSSEVNVKEMDNVYDYNLPYTLWQLIYRNAGGSDTISGVVPASFTCHATTRMDTNNQLNNISPTVNVISIQISADLPIDYNGRLQEIIDAIEQSGDAGEVLQNQREEDEQMMEDAQEGAEEGANNSSTNVSSSTGNFMSSIGAVIGALNSPGTNCDVYMNFGILNLGNVNLCQIPNGLKNIINGLSTIAITLAVLWTSYKGITTILEQIGNIVNT